LDSNSFSFVGGGIHFSDNNIGVDFEFGGNLIVNGGKTLAVSTPGGVEFNQDIFGSIHNNISEGFSDQNIGSIGGLGFRNGFRFISGRNRSSSPVVVESKDSIRSDGSLEFEFQNSSVFGGVDDSESGAGIIGDSDVISESFSESFSNLGFRKKDFSVELGGNGVKGFNGRFTGVVLGGQ